MVDNLEQVAIKDTSPSAESTSADKRQQINRTIFAKRELPEIEEVKQQSPNFEINPNAVKDLIIPISEKYKGVEVSVVGSAAADSERLGRNPRDVDLIIFTDDPANADAMYDIKDELEATFKEKGIEVDVFPFPGIDPRKPHITIMDGVTVTEDSVGDGSYFTDKGGGNKPGVDTRTEEKINKDTDKNILHKPAESTTQIEQLPDNKVKITQPDGSYIIGQRNEDGTATPSKMHIPKGADGTAVRDSLREEFYRWSQDNGASGVSGNLTKTDSLRSNIRIHGDNLKLMDPSTGKEISSTEASKRISRGEKVQYKVDTKPEPVPENRRVPQVVEDARKSIQNRDFRAFDELEQKYGPDSPWIESLRREAIRNGVKTHDVSPDETHHRRSLREKAETWEKEKKEEEEFRANHPYRAKAQDLSKTIDQGNTGSKIGRENPHTQWLERYREQSKNWKEGDTDWPQPIEPSDEYIEYANPQYTGLAEHLPPGLVRNDNGDLQYTTPDTGGWPITHTPGEPWRPENVTPGVSNRMNEIPNSEWDARGVEGLNERDVMKQLVEELFRRQMEEDETQRREERKTREKNRQEKEKRQREIEERKKLREDEEKENDKDTTGDAVNKKPIDGDGERKVDAKKPSDRVEEDEESPDSREVDKRPEDDTKSDDKPDARPEEKSKAPDLKGPELPSPEDFPDLVKGPGFVDRVREKMAERREAEAARKEGFEPTPRGPGYGERAGKALREQINKWIENHAKELQQEMQKYNSDDEGNTSDNAPTTDPRPRNNQSPPFSFPDQLREQVTNMSISELRDALQSAAKASGNVDQFMTTPVGNTGKTYGDFYGPIEESASRARGVGPGEYRGPLTISQQDMQSVKETLDAPSSGSPTPTSSEPVTRAADPDPTAPTTADEVAMQNIQDILSK